METLENAESRSEDGRSKSRISAEKVGRDPPEADCAACKETPEKRRAKRAYEVTMLMRYDRYYYETMTVDAYSAAHAIHQVIDWLIDHTDTDWEDFEFKAVCEKKKWRRR